MMKVLSVLLFLTFVSIQCTKSTPTETIGSGITTVDLVPRMVPLFVGKENNTLYDLKIKCTDIVSQHLSLTGITIFFTQESRTDILSAVSVGSNHAETPLFGTTGTIASTASVNGEARLVDGTNFFSLNFTAKANAALNHYFDIKELELQFSDKSKVKVAPLAVFHNRPTLILRAAGQDQVNTYRIPGLATTNKGTQIAVYDNRYLASGDLQGDIDVGMSRSTDGGQTWEPMRRILDMGTYNGLPQNQNGVGDPTVLVDKNTNTIWVAGLWVSGIPGQSAWNGSKPGMLPGETGQFVLTKSEDDGLTWSSPINITSQCKLPEWNLFFQGPGMGITLKDGTLVFPAQYKDAQKVPWSTLIYSKDHGKTWVAGTGPVSNTTESQVVQLPDGSLMLNMRDDRNRTEKGEKNGRAVAITKDLGQTWTIHPTSNGALPESNCQASLISARVMIGGAQKEALFFSNPNDKSSRAHMTIKASLDQGNTWPVSFYTELNSNDSYGYSCLTMVNDTILGILFEGTKDLYYQQIEVAEILKN